MAAGVTPSPVDDREIVRCSACKLNQFRTLNNLCRKCGSVLPDNTDFISVGEVSSSGNPEAVPLEMMEELSARCGKESTTLWSLVEQFRMHDNRPMHARELCVLFGWSPEELRRHLMKVNQVAARSEAMPIYFGVRCETVRFHIMPKKGAP